MCFRGVCRRQIKSDFGWNYVFLRLIQIFYGLRPKEIFRFLKTTILPPFYSFLHLVLAKEGHVCVHIYLFITTGQRMQRFGSPNSSRNLQILTHLTFPTFNSSTFNLSVTFKQTQPWIRTWYKYHGYVPDRQTNRRTEWV